MKVTRFALAVLFVLGLLSASVNTTSGSSGNGLLDQHWKKADTTDSNGGGGPIPPIGH